MLETSKCSDNRSELTAGQTEGIVQREGLSSEVFSLKTWFSRHLSTRTAQHLFQRTLIGALARLETIFDSHGTYYLQERDLKFLPQSARGGGEKMFLDVAIDQQPSTKTVSKVHKSNTVPSKDVRGFTKAGVET